MYYPKKGSMPTEVLVHWARWKVAGDPVLLIDLTVSSSFTKPRMTEGKHMLQTTLLPYYEVYRYCSSKQSLVKNHLDF